MTDISQWTINIRLWHCCHVLRSATKGSVNVTGLVESLLCSENGDVTNLVFSLIMFFFFLLILSGDIELNPGPLTDVTNNFKKITGYKKTRLSDLESYDGSSRRGKEPASGRPFIKKGYKRPNQMKEFPPSKRKPTTTSSHNQQMEEMSSIKRESTTTSKRREERLGLEPYSFQSDLYEDVPLRKRRSDHVSYDSDLESYDSGLESYDSGLESYDVSGRHDNGSTSAKPFTKKAISQKMSPSLPKNIPHEYKGHKRLNQMEETLSSKRESTTTTRAARMLQHNKTEDHIVEKLQLVKEQSTQLEEEEIEIVGKNYSNFNAAKDQQLSVEECGLKILIPAQVITPVDASYEITANGLWSSKFEFPEDSQLISGVCYISVSSSSPFNKPVTVLLEHCANITDKKQTQYLSFIIAKSGPPFKFEYLPGGSFCPGSQYGTIHLKQFSYLAIVVLGSVVGGAILGLGGVALGGAVGGAILGLGGVALGGVVGGAIFCLGGVALGGAVGGAIKCHYVNSTKVPNCNYRAYIFYKDVNEETWKMRFTVVQDTTYSNVILRLTSKFGNEEDNFPFRFASTIPSSREQDEAARGDIHTKKNLKLVGFPDEAVHGWEITPLRTPTIISGNNPCDFIPSRNRDPPNIPIEVSANPRLRNFRNKLRHPITIEGIEVVGSETTADDKPKIVITRSLTSNLQSNIVKGGVHVSTLPDHSLDRQPTLQELVSHARTAEWFQLGVKLGLDNVALNGRHDCTSMYQLWIEEKARGATRRSLLDALRAIRQNNVADVYEDHLKTMVGNNESVQSI